MTKKEKFIEKIKPLAVLAFKEFNILPSLTIVQAICESGWGKSSLTSKYNNLFGMKWTKNCGYYYVELLTSEYVNGKYIRVKAKFRKYDSWEDSIKDHSRLLQKSRYKPVLECKDYICATEQIRKCGYATSPTYTQTLRKIIEQNSLQLIDKEAKEDKEAEQDFEVDIEQFVNLLKETKEIVEKLLEKMRKILSE